MSQGLEEHCQPHSIRHRPSQPQTASKQYEILTFSPKTLLVILTHISQNPAIAGSLYTGHNIMFVSFTLLGGLDTLLPVFMLSAALPKSSAWDLTSKSCSLWWQCLHEVFHMYRFWSPFVLLRKAGPHCCSPQRIERNEGRWTHSSAGGRKDASGKLLVLLPPKSNCSWQIGQAEHGLLHPVGQTGLTALVVAKHRIIKNREGKAQTTSCPPQFHKAPSAVCLVSS